ncbi:MAG: hypothetical protein KGQ89_04770, partial [Verrucomicrobia bacterium]|nr:hypothetical protein [Verrucomicrobiota bacterium]
APAEMNSLMVWFTCRALLGSFSSKIITMKPCKMMPALEYLIGITATRSMQLQRPGCSQHEGRWQERPPDCKQLSFLHPET